MPSLSAAAGRGRRPLWRSLLLLRAGYHDAGAAAPAGPVTISLPDGTAVRAGEPAADEVLSRYVGRPVALRLGRAPGSEIDRAVPGEVLAHGADAEVAFELLELGQQAPGDSFVPTPRCAIPALAHGPDPGNPQVLRAPARANRIPAADFGVRTCAGVYARVASPGRVRAGDEVRAGPATAAA